MYYLGDVQMVKFKIKATRFMLIKFTTSGRPMTVFPESRNSMCYLNKRLSILRTILVPQKGLYFYFHYLGKPSRRGRGGLYLKPNECATRLVTWGKGLIYLRALVLYELSQKVYCRVFCSLQTWRWLKF